MVNLRKDPAELPTSILIGLDGVDVANDEIVLELLFDCQAIALEIFVSLDEPYLRSVNRE